MIQSCSVVRSEKRVCSGFKISWIYTPSSLLLMDIVLLWCCGISTAFSRSWLQGLGCILSNEGLEALV